MQKTSHQRRMLSAQQSPGRVVLTEQVQGRVVEGQKCTIDFWWKKCRRKRAGFEAEVKAFSPFISIAFFPFSIPWCSNFSAALSVMLMRPRRKPNSLQQSVRARSSRCRVFESLMVALL